MPRLGYALSSEEHSPRDLIDHAVRAERAGFDFALISDHYHPWIDRQGNSSFVWSVIGGISETTERLVLGTGVTCPLIRIHPAIIAQAAATAADLMPGRFFLGVGTGENLNEHIVGERWPPIDMRLDMLEEAVGIIRLLWQGGQTTFYGSYYVVENARLYTLPEVLPTIMVAASGAKSAELAGRIGDGLIGVSPDGEVIDQFDASGGTGKPRLGQIGLCYASEKDEALRTAREYWPMAAIEGQSGQELPLPAHFEQLAAAVTDEEIERIVPCGPDLQQYVDAVQRYVDAGYDNIYLHQIGPDQEVFFQFFEQELAPAIEDLEPQRERRRGAA
jgi:coenzyme F420-dependent glucose-6-phosphate dehydrogenase